MTHFRALPTSVRCLEGIFIAGGGGGGGGDGGGAEHSFDRRLRSIWAVPKPSSVEAAAAVGTISLVSL